MKAITQALEKSKYILSEEGLFIFLDRLVRIFCVRMKRLFLRDEINIRKWESLKGSFEGERAFLIGNGPSLNKMPLHLLQNEHVICFNRFNLIFERLNWIPTFYCSIDDRVISDMIGEINQFTQIIDYIFLPDIHPYNINFKKRINNEENVFWLYLEKLPFTQNLPYCGINKTVANVGIQILAFLGFKEIYLIGVDMEYKEHTTVKKVNDRDVTSTEDDDPNHFDPRYFGQGRKYHYPRMLETLVRFEEAKRFFDKLDVKIMNAGIDSKLEIFPKIDFRTLFKISEEDEFQLFLSIIEAKLTSNLKINKHALSVNEVFPFKYKYLDNKEEIDINQDIFLCNLGAAVKLLPKMIFNFLPFGPIQDHYIFINRKLINE